MEQLSLLQSPIKSCALTGHRRLEENFDKKALIKTLETLILNGVETFYNGLAVGFDLLSAETVLDLKKTYPQIRLVLCVPFYGQEKGYSIEDKKRYAEILKNGDGCAVLSDRYYPGCFFKRNDYMCEQADMLLAYKRSEKGGTAYTVKKFMKKGGKIIFL